MMKNLFKNPKCANSIVFGVLVSVALLFFSPAHAQPASDASSINREFLLTWKADSFVPPGYGGRALPAGNMRITSAVDLLENGGLVDTSGMEINWLVNGRLLSSGEGNNVFSFVTADISTQDYEITARIARTPGEFVTKTITIPRVVPEIVIDTPYPRRVFSMRNARFRALPYFFPITSSSNLLYEWKINGEEPGGSEAGPSVAVEIPQELSSLRLGVRLRAILKNDLSLSASSESFVTFRK